MSGDPADRLATVPLEERAKAARQVILYQPGLDEAARRELLAAALWPQLPATLVMPEPDPIPEPDPPAPWGRCAYERCRAPLAEPVRQDGRPRRYCGPLCSAAARSEARHQPRPCETCGTMFTPAQVTTRYCGRACYPSQATKRRHQAMVE